jgi:hypothetical protein
MEGADSRNAVSIGELSLLYATSCLETSNTGSQSPEDVTIRLTRMPLAAQTLFQRTSIQSPHHNLPCLALKIETLSS